MDNAMNETNWTLARASSSRLTHRALCLIALLLLSLQTGFLAACGGEDPSTSAQMPPAPTVDSAKLSKTLAEFNRGGALMGQYQSGKAIEAYQYVLNEFPNWAAARFNLGLAHLHRREHLSLAKEAFEQVLKAEPNHLRAQFCLGMCHEYTDEYKEALACYTAVHKADGQDPVVAYKCGEMLDRLERIDEAIRMYEKVVAHDPGFLSATYQLAKAYTKKKQRDKALVLFQRFGQLNKAELTLGAFVVSSRYGSAGKYSLALDALHLPVTPPKSASAPRLLFSPETRRINVTLQPWELNAVAIQLPGIAVGDVNEDGHPDLMLTATERNGVTSVWLNDGHGSFARSRQVTDKGISPCLADVDNDGHLDLWLGRAGNSLLFRGDGKGNFSQADFLEETDASHSTVCARLFDLDSNGGLDLLSFRWSAGVIPAHDNCKAATSSIYANDREGRFRDIVADLGLAFPNTPIGSVVYDDFDNDRDMDLILFPVGAEPIAWVNDRVGQYHLLDAKLTGLSIQNALCAISCDPYKTENRDLLVFAGKRLQLFRNRGGFRFELDVAFENRFGRLGGTGGQWADLDNDGDLDIVIADAHRRNQTRGPVVLINQWPNARFANAVDVDPGCLLDAIETNGDASCVVADFNNDGKCDILLAAMNQRPILIDNITQGGHYIELDLVGARPQTRKAQSNRSAIGARVDVKAGMVSQQFTVGGASGPVSMTPLRLHVGIGENTAVQWLRIRWPDAMQQAELELAADQQLEVKEVNRLTSTCPHLFAWNGSQFELVSDFGGVGGLGYWLSPGHYAMPDPTEYVPIPHLQPRDGQYVLQILESLQETVYLDEAKLIAIDHPEDTEISPREMMAMNGSPPHFEVYCFRQRIEPVKATDHRGADVTRQIQRVDRHHAGTTDLDPRFLGFAQDHFVELDFGDRLRQVAKGPRLVLFLYGSTEYPYSSTNYAAYQVGLRLEAPSIWVWRAGEWVELLHEVGCPGGIQHVMTVDMTDRLLPTDRKIRITSNMDIYWDRIFLGVPLARDTIRIETVCVQDADLHFRGHARAYSPDGRRPELYDYARIERSIPWDFMQGRFTRYGDVSELIGQTDDCYAIMSRGDEITLRVPVDAFGPIASGFQRSFILKVDCYTKDMDLMTACSATVQPLPFHAMRSYPYGPDQQYPDTEKTRDYRHRYNTR